jgi:hypothetical protein
VDIEGVKEIFRNVANTTQFLLDCMIPIDLQDATCRLDPTDMTRSPPGAVFVSSREGRASRSRSASRPGRGRSRGPTPGGSLGSLLGLGLALLSLATSWARPMPPYSVRRQ